MNDSKSQINLNIWDMAGQDHYICLAKQHFQGARAAVIVFAINNAFGYKEVETYLD